MCRIVLFVCCLVQYSLAHPLDSIRTQQPKNFSAESWEVHIQQCLNKEEQSCQIIINNGLKTQEECKAKNECSVIGEVFWYANQGAKALPYFQKACESKNMSGCYFLGMYATEQKKFIQSLQYFDKACGKKHAPSCFMYANFYEHGKGVRQDFEKAAQAYKKSCKMSYAEACFALGGLHQEGKALTHNLSLAKEFYGKACDFGMQRGCDMYKELNQSGVPSLYDNKNVFD